MKAVTCPQCGAIIKRISLKDKFAFCDYCEAKILLPEEKEKIVESSASEEEKPTPYEKYLKKKNEFAQKYAAMNPPEYTEQSASSVWKPWLITVSVILLVTIFLASGRSCLDRPFDETKKTLATTKTPSVTPTPFQWTEPTFSPQINYSVSVRWNGDNDMEHFETPSIDQTKLPTSDVKELKKTVFANRSVQVRVTIDENGEVTQAKAISGHAILKEASENAARKTLFSNRSKPANRVLTYIFRLTGE